MFPQSKKVHDDDDDDDELEKKKLRSKLAALAKRSTFHGVSHVPNTERIFFKLLYTALLVCLLVFFIQRYISQTNSFIYRYLAYEVDTVLSTVKVDSAVFPAITICNLEVCGFTDYEYTAELKKYIDAEKARDNSAEEAIQFRLTTDKTKANLFWAREIFLVNYDDIKLNEVLNNESASIGNMLLNCQFNGRPCYSSQFEFFQMGEFQKCFKFNANKSGEALSLNQFSKEYGLKVELFIGEPEKCRSPLATASGLNIFVHNQTTMPTLDDDSILVQQGTQTDIAVGRTFLYRKPAPYSDCINKENAAESKSDLVKETLSLLNMYQQQYCLSLCYQRFLLLYCDCFDHTLPGFEPPDRESCPIFVDSTYNCIYVAKKLFYNGRNDANCSKLCPSECESIMYSSTVSFSRYPSPIYGRLLNESKPGTKYSNTSLSTKSILSLNIYYKNDEITVIQERPTTDIEQFLCEFGGMLGLFLGCGALSFIEIVEVILEAFLTKVDCCDNHSKIQTIQQQQAQQRMSRSKSLAVQFQSQTINGPQNPSIRKLSKFDAKSKKSLPRIADDNNHSLNMDYDDDDQQHQQQHADNDNKQSQDDLLTMAANGYPYDGDDDNLQNSSSMRSKRLSTISALKGSDVFAKKKSI